MPAHGCDSRGVYRPNASNPDIMVGLEQPAFLPYFPLRAFDFELLR
jgi:hypothetical protein